MNEYLEKDLTNLNKEAENFKMNLINDLNILNKFGYNFSFVCLVNDTTNKGEIGGIVNKEWELNPSYEIDLIKKGDGLCEQLKSYDKAIKLFNRTIHLPEALNSKGNALLNKKKYQEALKCFQSAIKLNSKYTKAYNNKGNCYFSLKKYDKALIQYNKAISLDSEYSHAYNGKGNVLNEKKQYEQAIVCFKKAIQIDPKYVNAYNGLGNSYLKLNCLEAIDYYDKALELDSDFTHAYNGKAFNLM